MSDIGISRPFGAGGLDQVPGSSLDLSVFPYILNGLASDLMQQCMSFACLWKFVVVLIILLNVKNLPLIWHLRILNAFRFTLKTQRPKLPLTPEHLFQPLITTTHAPLMEIDFNLHKNNASYFSDIDIARTHLVCTLFSTGIEHMRGGTGAITGARRPVLGLPVGGVSCTFKKELKPYEPYELWTRVLSWDEKWVYIVTHFVKAGVLTPRKYTLYPTQNKKDKNGEAVPGPVYDNIQENDAVVATALSRCVFKQGRQTISPVVMLQLSGLLPQDEEAGSTGKGTSVSSEELARGRRSSRRSSRVSNQPSPSSSDSGIDMEMDDDAKGESELRKIERERCRGLQIASTLTPPAQKSLERDFTSDCEALGRHRDGTGMTGVVSTLAQLAKLKKDQIL